MEKILCFCCGKNKNKLNVKRSNLLPINLMMCETCIVEKLEPRWVVILCGRQNGPDSVKEIVLKKRYCGQEIFASELLL